MVTTDSKHLHPVAPNVLARHFEATAPNQKRLADLTYVPTDEGCLYLALVLDLFSRKLVGWAMRATMPQELTRAALAVALALCVRLVVASIGSEKWGGDQEKTQMARYGQAMKDRVLGKLLPPESEAIEEVSRECRRRRKTGANQPT